MTDQGTQQVDTRLSTHVDTRLSTWIDAFLLDRRGQGLAKGTVLGGQNGTVSARWPGATGPGTLEPDMNLEDAFVGTRDPGGKSLGISRQGAPARTIQRKPSKTSRRLWSHWGAASVIKVKYGATNAHSSSVTSAASPSA